MSEIKLLPCPFCGKGAQIAPDEIGSGGQHVPPYHAGCLRGAGCGIAFTADDPDEAIAEWNRRDPSSQQDPAIDDNGEDQIILAMCKAHDREEAAQKGEPTPWTDEAEQDADFVQERFFAMREAFDVAREVLLATSPVAEASLAEPVAWRWKPKDSETWIYDPKHEWLEAQSRDEIDAEPLYLDPPPTSELEAENARLRKALEPLAKLADAVFRDGMNTDKRDEDGVWGFDDATLTYGHLRNARRVLEGGKVSEPTRVYEPYPGAFDGILGSDTPPAPKVTEAMVETEMVRMTVSETIRAMGANPDEQIIGELTVFDAVAVKVRAALTAAQEAGKP